MNTEQFWNSLISGQFLSMVKESAKGKQLGSSLQVFNVMKALYAKDEPDREHLYIIYMNRKNEILKIEKLFSGSIAGSAVYPREVIKKILEYRATSVVIVHNHPSGDPEPSIEDRQITFDLVVALKTIGVDLLDHIIIGRSYFSFADNGLIREYVNKYNSFLSRR